MIVFLEKVRENEIGESTQKRWHKEIKEQGGQGQRKENDDIFAKPVRQIPSGDAPCSSGAKQNKQQMRARAQAYAALLQIQR